MKHKIMKALIIGVLVTLCFGDHRKQLKGDHDGELVEEIKVAPIPYNFEYNTEDVNGTSQFRKESSDGNGKVQGRYGYKDAFGIERIVEYVADENGYRAQVKTNEPGTESMSPAAVQFRAQPIQMSYQIPRETQRHQQRDSAESTMKHLNAEVTDKSFESSLSNQAQNQQYSTVSSTLPPSYKQYTFFGQEQPTSVVHHSNGQSPVAIPIQEPATSQYKPLPLGFYSAPQQPLQKSQEQEYGSSQSLEQQYNNQKSQAQQYSNQKSQELQYSNPKSQEQQYNHKSQEQQQHNQKSQEQQYSNQKSQEHHKEIQKPQVQQYTNQKSQELQYISLKPQEQQPYDHLRSQGQIIHQYNPNLQYIGQNIPQEDILIPAKQFYQQPAPQNLVPATVQKHSYSLLPIPQAYSQDSNAPLVHQFISLQNQATVHPTTISSSSPVEYAYFPAYSQKYSPQEKQISVLSAQRA